MSDNIYVSPTDLRGRNAEARFIQEFLQKKEPLVNVSESGFPFVTISRESSAGGHLLSYVLMSEFEKQTDPNGLFKGWHVFDRQLCEMIAHDVDMRQSVEQLLHDKYHSEFKDYVDSLFTGHSDMYTLQKSTSRVIHMLAATGKVIIVSSHACFVTRDLKAGVHVRLVAPEPRRIAWMMKRFNMNKPDAQKAVEEQDSCQKELISKIFNKHVSDPLLYDAVWNTARVEMQEIASSVIDMIRHHAQRPARVVVAPNL